MLHVTLLIKFTDTIIIKGKANEESKRHLQKGFPLKDGPFFNQLDVALQSFNVERQSYYGGVFIGNHVHAQDIAGTLVYISVKGPTLYHCANVLCTQPKNIKTLCNSLAKVVVNAEPSLTADILKTSDTFQNILEMFATCHKLYDSSFSIW